MRKRLLPLSLAMILALTACSGEKAEVTPDPLDTPTPSPIETTAPSPTPYTGPENPLTGLPIGEDWLSRRPVAIMLNNLEQALPQQGQSQADLIYECLEEGGITRMMGVYQSLEGVGTVGSIRSARSYYLELALGHDAIFIHAGGSDEVNADDAYGKIKAWGVTNLDGVRGPYMSNTVEGNLMWRDPQRKKNNGSVHSVVTTGEKMMELLPTYSFRQEHEAGYTYAQPFADDGTPMGGETANTLRVPFSSYKTGVFCYDQQSETYLVEEYGAPYVDGNTGQQVGVTNVIVVQTGHKEFGNSYGHISVKVTGGGDGYYACGGKVIPIKWSKPDRDSPLTYTTADGQPLVLGRGKSYVNVVPLESAITWEE